MANYYPSNLYVVSQVPCPYGHTLRYANLKKNKKLGRCVDCNKRFLQEFKDKQRSKRLPPKFFRCNYAENPTKFSAPFDGCFCIPLSSGQHALVDSEDYDLVKDKFWYLSGGNTSHDKMYATSCGRTDEKRTASSMHYVIKPKIDGLFTDHINRNSLDNRKANLRYCTKLENSRNKSHIKSKSKYKGVNLPQSLRQVSVIYQARIRVNGKLISIGRFRDEIEAARAYDEAAIKYFGEYASLNFPETIRELTRNLV